MRPSLAVTMAGCKPQANRILTSEAMQDMTPGNSPRRAFWAISALAVIGLALVQACAASPRGPSSATLTSEAGISIEVAATLTAWPTPPPLVTRPPTPTAAPQPLWTSDPSPVASTPGPNTTPAQSLVGLPGSGSRPVRLLIPDLGLDVPVVEVSWIMVAENGGWHSEWQTADHAAGHHRGSANPGEAGNMVISGHHNTKGEVFRQVSDVGLSGNPFNQGDTIVVVSEDGRKFAYRVVLWDRFREDGATAEETLQHAHYLEPTETAILTLVTCWPYESNTHRVIIVAQLVP